MAAPGPCGRLLLAEAREVDLGHQLVPDLHEIAAVEILAGDRGVGERRDQVLAPELGRLDAAGPRGHVDGTLHGEAGGELAEGPRSEEHTSELQSLMRISYAVFCL